MVTAVRVRGLNRFKDRYGKERVYHRATGQPLPGPIGSPDFWAEYNRLNALVEKKAKPRAGTLGSLIAAYRAHTAFTERAPQTRADYQKVFDYLKPIDSMPLNQLTRQNIVLMRDDAQAKGVRFANYLKAVLSIIGSWGAERGWFGPNGSNPASGIKDIRRNRNLPDRNRPWTDAEREAVLAASPPHILTPIALMMFAGLGPKDALTLQKEQYRDGEISTSRAKTGERVFWPAPIPLAMILAAAPAHDADTLCANSEGKAWTLTGFNSSWRYVRMRLEAAGKVQPGLTPYGLRHTVAVILREIGHDERAIADALGQRTIEMARHYAKGADLAPKMRGIVASLDAEFARRSESFAKPLADRLQNSEARSA